MAHLKNLEKFLKSIPDEKLGGFFESEHTLWTCYTAGFRLDYQGTNVDKKEYPHVHRLYIQPVGGSKSQSKSKRDQKAKKKNSAVCSRCHASTKATAEEIRQALLDSYENRAKTVGYAPVRK